MYTIPVPERSADYVPRRRSRWRRRVARLVVGVPLVLVLLAGAFLGYRVLWGMPDTNPLPGVVREPVDRYAAMLDPYMPEPLWIASDGVASPGAATGDAAPPPPTLAKPTSAKPISAVAQPVRERGPVPPPTAARPGVPSTPVARKRPAEPDPDPQPTVQADREPEAKPDGKITDFFGLEVTEEDLQ